MTTGFRKRPGAKKVKTGCATCRIRKIKCDETKPFCQKCVKTGRSCDGYESIFRLVSTLPATNTRKLDTRKAVPEAATRTFPLDATSLNRYFSTKTIFDVDLSCNREAEQVLQESLTNDSVRHALLSLRALRGNLETTADNPPSPDQQRLSYKYGLEHYNKALTGLALNLSSPSPGSLKTALLCCQVLISVEQVKGNFSAMGVHIVRGLNIMREYRARPYLVDTNILIPATHKDLPSIDVFILKLFAAPCKFKEQATAEVTMKTPPVETSIDRKIAPNMRAAIRRISDSTIDFLGQVSLVESAQGARELVGKRDGLLVELETWFVDFSATLAADEPETVHHRFLTFFYRILKVVLLGTIDYVSDSNGRLKAENEKIQILSDDINERLRHYDMSRRIEGSLRQQS